MIEEGNARTGAPPNETRLSEPHLGVDAVVDESLKSQSLGDDLSEAESFVAAFVVTIVADRFTLSAPVLGIEDTVSVNVTGESSLVAPLLLAVPRLPIKDLANPGVALVVRSSLERLVKAARALTGRICSNEPPTRVEVRAFTLEAVAALEPFAEVGHD